LSTGASATRPYLGLQGEPGVRARRLEPAVPRDRREANTIYVANFGSNTVSVIDGSGLHALKTAGCGRPRATVSVGPIPFTVA